MEDLFLGAIQFINDNRKIIMPVILFGVIVVLVMVINEVKKIKKERE